jgi:hypothetical protein
MIINFIAHLNQHAKLGTIITRARLARGLFNLRLMPTACHHIFLIHCPNAMDSVFLVFFTARGIIRFVILTVLMDTISFLLS